MAMPVARFHAAPFDGLRRLAMPLRAAPAPVPKETTATSGDASGDAALIKRVRVLEATMSAHEAALQAHTETLEAHATWLELVGAWGCAFFSGGGLDSHSTATPPCYARRTLESDVAPGDDRARAPAAPEPFNARAVIGAIAAG